jgi:ferredoxin-NADP reductase
MSMHQRCRSAWHASTSKRWTSAPSNWSLLTQSPLPAFSAGSHVDVHLPGGLTRPYSLCNDPTESHRYVIAVLRDPQSRGGSRAMHEEVFEGQLLQISPPKNHFPLAHDARRHLLLAGGIGVTPILCMAERLANTGADFEMHYNTRSAARTAFRQRIADAAFASRVHFHFDDGDAGQKLDIEALLAAPASEVHLYVCGPKGFMDAVLKAGAGQQRGPKPQLALRSTSPARWRHRPSANVAFRCAARELRQGSLRVPAGKTVDIGPGRMPASTCLFPASRGFAAPA